MTMGQFPQHHYGFFDHNLLPHFNNNFTTDHHNLTTNANNSQADFYHIFFAHFNFNSPTK